MDKKAVGRGGIQAGLGFGTKYDDYKGLLSNVTRGEGGSAESR